VLIHSHRIKSPSLDNITASREYTSSRSRTKSNLAGPSVQMAALASSCVSHACFLFQIPLLCPRRPSSSSAVRWEPCAGLQFCQDLLSNSRHRRPNNYRAFLDGDLFKQLECTGMIEDLASTFQLWRPTTLHIFRPAKSCGRKFCGYAILAGYANELSEERSIGSWTGVCM
jgi:hypothetical protein